jgi:glycosyltransferase involved in cell wall biosynthesis
VRVAWLTHFVPAPENTGGRIRVARLARALAAREGVAIDLYARVAAHDRGTPLPVGGEGPWARVEAIAPSFWQVGGSPPWLPRPARSMPRGLAKGLLAEHARSPYDAVVASHCFAARGLVGEGGPLLVVDEHNVESDFMPQGGGAGYEKLAMERFERAVWRRAAAVSVVSEGDAARVRRFCRGEVAVVPNGIVLERYQFRAPSSREGTGVLFVGLLAYGPNVEAAKVLAREVMPRLRGRVPGAYLTLVGSHPSAEVRALAGPGVRVEADVPSVAPFFDGHAAYAMPLAAGAGTSLKVLEPLAAGLPLVATRFAVRGYDAIGADHYVPAEGADEMADALALVLEGRAALDPMAERARAFAASYAWDALGARFADVVLGAIRAGGGR